MTTATQANAPLLHRLLGIGQVTLAAIFLGLTYTGSAPLIGHATDSAMIANMLAAIPIALLAVALLVQKPRVPGRQPGQSAEAFWSTKEVVSNVTLVWFLMEGAGVISAVGFFLIGGTVAAIVMGVTIAAFWMCGPATFVKE